MFLFNFKLHRVDDLNPGDKTTVYIYPPWTVGRAPGATTTAGRIGPVHSRTAARIGRNLARPTGPAAASAGLPSATAEGHSSQTRLLQPLTALPLLLLPLHPRLFGLDFGQALGGTGAEGRGGRKRPVGLLGGPTRSLLVLAPPRLLAGLGVSKLPRFALNPFLLKDL